MVYEKKCTFDGCPTPLQPLENFGKVSSHKDGLSYWCRACCATYQRQHKSTDEYKEKRRLAQRQRYATDPDFRKATRAATARWAATNKEHVQKYARAWYEDNKERLLEGSRAWSALNPERKRQARAKRRALLADAFVEYVDFKVLRLRDTVCYLCNQSITDLCETHVDHKIPLSRTELSPTHCYQNCAVVHSACNLRKADNTPEEYWASIDFSGENG